jgi:riboflavin synthase
MFTGIVTDIGTVRAVQRDGDTRIEIATSFDAATIDIGASISCSGACLTVIDKGRGWFAASVSAETLSRTVLGGWAEGTRINLERPLRVGEELGGHMVLGHVDGVAHLVEARPEGDSARLVFDAPGPLARFIAAKGSLALDGVSLTVNEVDGGRFGVNIIPHTRVATTLGGLAPGDPVNLEIDMLARYVARLMEKD